jgi:hypothetical protein
MSTINYGVAGRWKDVIRALVEGDENPSGDIVAVGDGGRAFGILQEHPSFFWQFYGRNGFDADVKDTWTVAFIKAAASFFEHYCREYELDLMVQAYNQGARAVFIQGMRAPGYLAKFHAVYDKLAPVKA